MDISSPLWLSELEMDNLVLMDQCEMSLDQESFDSFASESYPADYPSFGTEIPTSNSLQTGIAKPTPKQFETTSNNVAIPKVSSGSSSNIISFGNDKGECPNDSLEYFEGMTKVSQGCRSPKQAQYHKLKERKRRERMGRQLVDLAALIPKTRKMDKPSVLEEAIRYIKELKGRVKEVEEGESRDNMESVVSVKKRSRVSVDDDDASSSEENSPSSGDILLSPEIEVNVSGGSVLVKIHCQNQSGLIVKALNEIQKHGLSIISSNAAPFANSTLLINIIAQMEDGFFMTTKNLVKKLRLAILRTN